MTNKMLGRKGFNFKLKDQDGQDVTLDNFQGKKVLLSFHPLAWTEICKKQMLSLENNWEIFNKLNTVPLGFSTDAVPTKKAWAQDIGINKVSLPADFWPHGEVAIKYKLFRGNDGFSERANVILDEEHNIIFYKIYPLSELPDIKEIIEFLENH